MNQDEFLTEIIGKPVYNIDDPFDYHEDYKRGALYCCKTDNLNDANGLSSEGFWLVSTEIQLSRAVPVNYFGPYWKAGAVSYEREQILDIAESSFIYDRFHNDPYISDVIAGRIKRQWALNYLMKKRGDFVLAVLGGFLCILKRPGEYVIDLIGVDKNERRKGIGKKLIQQLFSCIREESFPSVGNCRIVVGTQLDNIPSLKLYQAMGFDQIDGFNYVFHLHT